MLNNRKEPSSDEDDLTPQAAYENSNAFFINYLATQDVDQLNQGKTLLIESAQAGYYPAQCYLGSLYLHGQLLEKDLEEGTRWLDEADKQTHLTPEEKKNV